MGDAEFVKRLIPLLHQLLTVHRSERSRVSNDTRAHYGISDHIDESLGQSLNCLGPTHSLSAKTTNELLRPVKLDLTVADLLGELVLLGDGLVVVRLELRNFLLDLPETRLRLRQG